MKRVFPLVLIIAMPFMALAQIRQQAALVKTHGRLQDDGSVVAGRRISDALVEIKGGAKILSDEQGALSFSVSVSDGYSISRVSKAGYVLSDWDIISRHKQYSATPVDILLESIEEQNAYRRTIERKVRKNYNAQLEILQTRIDSLRSLPDANEQEIASSQAHIDKSYDEAEQYVDEMTNRYLNIDFDRAEDFDRQISVCILNGELEKADSMLATKGDIVARVRQNKAFRKAVMQDTEEVGKDCYRKYEIASQRLQRDSAAYYLELRANLDSHNIDWQMEAGEYISEILAEYNRALKIYEPALIYSQQHYGEPHYKTAILYNNIGKVYYNQSAYSKALEYFIKVLTIRKKVLDGRHPDIAQSYNNIGAVYSAQKNDTMAMNYYLKALAIREKILGEEHPDTATSYNNIGLVYCKQGDYSKALEYHLKALAIFVKVLGEEHPVTATSYDNIGFVYYLQEDSNKALEYYNKALAIRKKVLGGRHPDIAQSYNNIGWEYYMQGDYSKFFCCSFKAAKILGKENSEKRLDAVSLTSALSNFYPRKSRCIIQ